MRRYLAVSAAIGAALTVVTAVAGCGSVPATAGHGVGTSQLPASFTRQARLVVDRWDRSATARVWDTGLVLVGASSGGRFTQIPEGAGFGSGPQKAMFFSGHFRLGTALPAGSPTDVVRWASGSTRRVPVEDSAAAFAELATKSPCGCHYGSLGDLTVTSMRPTTVSLPTSRGEARIPAWQFRVAQLSWPFTEVAVPPRDLAVLPYALRADVTELIAVSKSGRELTLEAQGGGCAGQPLPHVTALVYETPGAVVVGTKATSAGPASANQVCAGVGLRFRLHATLKRPLGNRVVLDVGSGQPLALNVPANLP